MEQSGFRQETMPSHEYALEKTREDIFRAIIVQKLLRGIEDALTDNDFSEKEDYSIGLWKPNEDPNNLNKTAYVVWNKPTIQTYTQNISIVGERGTIGLWHYKIWLGAGHGVLEKEPNRLLVSGEYGIYPKEACTLGLPILEMSSPVKISTTTSIKVRNINPESDYLLWFLNSQVFNNGKFPSSSIIDDKIVDRKTGVEKAIKTAYFSVVLGNEPGKKILCLKHGKTNLLGFGKDNCEVAIPIEVTILTPLITPSIVQSSKEGASLKESQAFSAPTSIPPLPPCAIWANLSGTPIPRQEAEIRKDKKCLEVNTGLGIGLKTDPAGLVKSIMGIVLSISGGIATLLLIISGYKMIFSQGNPEAIQGGRDQFVSAVVGLLFIIFSLVILQTIGVDILHLPGFEK